ncbi:MAG TPA: 5-oxoprolinase subunit PxpB [Candidatus Methylomirabilis sp.]|nr:5-oxoprolinase subunit PxpB [Candidatus Methylomirabilis sp.]
MSRDSRIGVRFVDAGESCLVVELGDRIDVALNLHVRTLCLAVERAGLAGVQEAVPTYRSLAIYYDPLRIGRGALKENLDALLHSTLHQVEEQPRVVEVPTVYGSEYGPDLEFVARHTGLSQDVVIRLHTEPLYHVHMLGFTAGFPYLGGLSERLSVPRLHTPRLKVPAGSVGIAGTQTGVYPLESPGGWRIIGRTSLCLFDPSRQIPTPILPGDNVRFVQIPQRESQEATTAARH